ncbi:MAG: LPS export ABC transporter periplasmic protein LptC [bacterium]
MSVSKKIRIFITHFKWRGKVLLFLFFFISVSCENDIERINTVTQNQDFPTLSGFDAEFLYSDSGLVQIKIETPEYHRYTMKEEPYMEFPYGIIAYFYNDSLEIESEISANYAKYFVEEKLWEARGDVIGINHVKNEQLNTEELFWDEKERLIYSEKFSRISTNDGVFYGEEGFEADQNFTRWKLIGTRGNVKIENEEE